MKWNEPHTNTNAFNNRHSQHNNALNAYALSAWKNLKKILVLRAIYCIEKGKWKWKKANTNIQLKIRIINFKDEHISTFRCHCQLYFLSFTFSTDGSSRAEANWPTFRLRFCSLLLGKSRCSVRKWKFSIISHSQIKYINRDKI